MQQIYISDQVLSIQEEYCKNLFSKRKNNFIKPLKKLNDILSKISIYLSSGDRTANWRDYYDYVSFIINHYEEILALKPSEFDNYHQVNFSFLSQDQLKIKLFGAEETFYEIIVNAMRYDAVRDKEFAQYIRRMGIKSCVYCNSQYTVPTHGKGMSKKDVTTYEIDHYYPKSQYPYLCTTFFNLVPSCGPCNRRKNDNKVSFCLYVDPLIRPQRFHFSIEKASVIKYLASHNPDDINLIISYNEPELSDSLSTFYLQDIYNEHKDKVEELIWKHRIYKSSYRNLIKSQFGSLIKSDEEIYRLFFGVFPPTDSIHKRPLSLFINDIKEILSIHFPKTY